MALLAKHPPKTSATPAPASLEDFPAYREANDHLRELHSRLQAAIRRRGEIQGKLAHLDSATNRNTAEVAALLSGGDLHDVGESLEQLRTDYNAAEHEIRVLQQAIPQQERIVAARQCEASRAICEAIRPKYNARVARLLAAAVELARAEASLRELCDDLDRCEIRRGTLPGFSISDMGRLTDSTSKIRYRLREARDNGIPLPDLPELEQDSAWTGPRRAA